MMDVSALVYEAWLEDVCLMLVFSVRILAHESASSTSSVDVGHAWRGRYGAQLAVSGPLVSPPECPVILAPIH